jgi:hypothetical protein
MLSGGLSILKEGTAMLLFSAVAATFFVVIYSTKFSLEITRGPRGGAQAANDESLY